MADNYFGAMLINVSSMELSIVNLKTGAQTERVKSNVAIGENIYNHEEIDFETVAEAAEALRGFLQIIKDYGVTNYKLWGSQALSTAPNAEFIRDQIFVRTGLSINWLSLGEESFVRNEAIALKFDGYHHLVKKHAARCMFRLLRVHYRDSLSLSTDGQGECLQDSLTLARNGLR